MISGFECQKLIIQNNLIKFNKCLIRLRNWEEEETIASSLSTTEVYSSFQLFQPANFLTTLYFQKINLPNRPIFRPRPHIRSSRHAFEWTSKINLLRFPLLIHNYLGKQVEMWEERPKDSEKSLVEEGKKKGGGYLLYISGATN